MIVIFTGYNSCTIRASPYISLKSFHENCTYQGFLEACFGGESPPPPPQKKNWLLLPKYYPVKFLFVWR